MRIDPRPPKWANSRSSSCWLFFLRTPLEMISQVYSLVSSSIPFWSRTSFVPRYISTRSWKLWRNQFINHFPLWKEIERETFYKTTCGRKMLTKLRFRKNKVWLPTIEKLVRHNRSLWEEISYETFCETIFTIGKLFPLLRKSKKFRQIDKTLTKFI